MTEPRAGVLYTDDTITGKINVSIAESFMIRREDFLSTLDRIESVQQIDFIKTKIATEEFELQQLNPSTYDSYMNGQLYQDDYIVATQESRRDFQLARYILFLNDELNKRLMINDYNNRNSIWEEATESFDIFYNYLKKQLIIDVNYEQFVQCFKGLYSVKFNLGSAEMSILLTELVQNEFMQATTLKELIKKGCILTNAKKKDEINTLSLQQYQRECTRYSPNTNDDNDKLASVKLSTLSTKTINNRRKVTSTVSNILSVLNIRM